jgi:hypothetical protein
VPAAVADGDYVHLARLFSSGEISKASKSELERYGMMLSRPNARQHFSGSSFSQICEIVRVLLSARTSEDASAARRTSALAVCIALAALVVTALQTISTIWGALPITSTSAVAPAASSTQVGSAQVLEQNQR